MISSTERPRRCWSSAISSRIWAWMVTSSAVVGSSAISSSRLARQGHGDQHALAHAARHLVRVLLDALARVGDADQVEQLDGPRAGPPASSMPRWRRSTSAIWVPTVNSGLSEVIGSWKIIAISLPRTCAQRALGVGHQRLALPAHVAAGDLSGQLDQAHQRLGGDALAGAALADEAERLAASDGEADVAHGVHRPAPGEELDVQVVDLEQGLGRRVGGRVGRRSASGSVALTRRSPGCRWHWRRSASRALAGRAATRSQLLSRLAASTVRLSRIPG